MKGDGWKVLMTTHVKKDERSSALNLIRQLPGAVVLLSTDEFRVKYFSDDYREYLPKALENKDLIGVRFADYVADGESNPSVASVRCISESGKGKEIKNYRIKNKDGVEFWVDWIGSPVENDTEKWDVLLQIRDITELKQTEEALREGEAKLNRAQSIARLGSWEWDLVTDEVTGSEELYRMFSLTPDPKTFFQRYIDTLVVEDRQRVLDALDNTIKNNAPYNIDYRVVLRDGSERYIHAEALAQYDNGRPIKVYGTAQDITERKKAEDTVKEERDRLNSLINSISDEVWFSNTEGKFTLTNPSAIKEFVLDPNEKIEARKLAASLEVFRADGSPRPVDEAPTSRALKGEVIRDLEEIIRTPGTGELRYRLVNASPVRGANGDIIGSVAVVRDITDIKLAQREAEENAELARRRTEEVETIMDTVPAAIWVAHDPECRVITGNQAADSFYESKEEENRIGRTSFGRGVGPDQTLLPGRPRAKARGTADAGGSGQGRRGQGLRAGGPAAERAENRHARQRPAAVRRRRQGTRQRGLIPRHHRAQEGGTGS